MTLVVYTPNPAIARRSPPAPHLTLPLYALDGRRLQWNADRTAVAFDSTAAEYHSDRDAVSSTALKAFARSPAHMIAKVFGGAGRETLSQRLGSAVHARLLEMARFATDYVMFDGRRQGLTWDLFKMRHSDKQILTRAEWELVAECCERLRKQPAVESDGQVFTVGDLVQHGQVERVIYWLDRATGLTCKARLDLMVDHVTFDVKTTDDAREGPFGSQCDRLGYDVQAAFYRRARRAMDPDLVAAPFAFIAVELAEPFAAQVHVADEDDFMAYGEERVASCMKALAECRKQQSFPAYPVPTRKLRLPAYRRFPGVEP